MARGFLLHSRPFRESSVIATFLTDTDGRLDLIVRSARGKQGKKTKPVLPFCLYELSWVGRGELKNLQSHEPIDAAIDLVGNRLFCGLYLNELLHFLLPKASAEYAILQAYASALRRLGTPEDIEPILRNFEILLLESLGYGIDFFYDTEGDAVIPDATYQFVPEHGLVKVSPQAVARAVGKGESFLAIGNCSFSSVEVLRLAKATLRLALSIYLGNNRLRSREFFL
jgi:DNA repair protein RecO (recombination protein O)